MFKTCLNTSTIRGYKLSLREEISVAARAGYDAIEPWLGELSDNQNDLESLANMVRDNGLTVQGAIGFFDWIVDDESQRKKALETARHDMELVHRFGGTLIAAPPMGMTDKTGLNLFAAAERYAALCDIGREFGVRPMVEVWGFSKTLNRLGEAALIAIESGHQDAAILADVYHLYKGGSPINGLKQLNGSHLPIFHVNDYPKTIAPADIKDEDRIFTGDGDAPLKEILQTLQSIGFSGHLSLELFNPNYYKTSALETAKTGREKLGKVLDTL